MEDKCLTTMLSEAVMQQTHTKNKEVLEVLDEIMKHNGRKVYVCETMIYRKKHWWSRYKPVIVYSIYVDTTRGEFQDIQLPEYTLNCVLSYLYGAFLLVYARPKDKSSKGE